MAYPPQNPEQASLRHQTFNPRRLNSSPHLLCFWSRCQRAAMTITVMKRHVFFWQALFGPKWTSVGLWPQANGGDFTSRWRSGCARGRVLSLVRQKNQYLFPLVQLLMTGHEGGVIIRRCLKFYHSSDNTDEPTLIHPLKNSQIIQQWEVQ